jgi:hypothetical protein
MTHRVGNGSCDQAKPEQIMDPVTRFIDFGTDGEFSKEPVIQYYKTLTLPNGREIRGFPLLYLLFIVRVDLDRISVGRGR